VDGRVIYRPGYRPSTFIDLQDTVEWWSALLVLGALLILAGALVVAGLTDPLAVAGVALFFATAVAAGSDRIELATAFGAAGVVWTATGIALALGTDGLPIPTAAAFQGVGLVALFVAAAGWHRARGRSKRFSESSG
jgi:hypothetical protein